MTTSNCIGPTAASTGAMSPRRSLRFYLDDAFAVELVHPLAELFVLVGGGGPQRREVFGCERRDRRELHLGTGEQRIAGGECHRVHQTHHITGVGTVDRGAVTAEHRLCVLGCERFTGLRVRDDHAAFELAGHDAHEREPVAVAGVHAGLVP